MGIYDRDWYRNNGQNVRNNEKISKEEAEKLRRMFEGNAPPKVDPKYKFEFVDTSPQKVGNTKKYQNSFEHGFYENPKGDDSMKHCEICGTWYDSTFKACPTCEASIPRENKARQRPLSPTLILIALSILVFTVVIALSTLKPVSAGQNKKENSSTRPFNGYDNIPWGASPSDVRDAYNLSEEFALVVDKEDPNFATITIHYSYKESAIIRRDFYFNKWNDDKYKLYRVYVEYAEEDKNDTVGTLKNMLISTYGNITRSYSDSPKSARVYFIAGNFKSHNYIFGKYSPSITVQLINNEKTSRIYLGVISPIEKTTYNNEVIYTWTQFRDRYQDSLKQKIQL